MEPFVLRALFAGVMIAAVAGVLGCFVVWRRMAYFGDSLAHGALLGAAAGLALSVDLQVAAVVVCVLFAPALALLRRQGTLADDTSLGILAHGSLAFALIALSLADVAGFDLRAYLFGDILAVGEDDLWRIAAGGLLALAYLFASWQALTLMTVNEDLAACEGVRVLRAQIVLTFMTAVIVALGVRIIGALLITSLLIVPAAAARQFAPTPGWMAAGAAGVGVLSVLSGMAASLQWDLPAGAAIAASCVLLFGCSLVFGRLLRALPL